MNKSKIVFTILGILLLVGGLGAGLYLVGQRQILTKRAAPASTMYVSPGTITKNAGDNFSFAVDVDTASNQMNGFDVRLSFDPGAMEVVSLLSLGSGVTDFTTEAVNTYDNATGKISYSHFTADVSKAVTGSGIEVLMVSAKVKATAVAGDYSLTLDPASLATDINETQNILVGKTNGTLTVSGVASSPTGSATASPGGSASPTATPGGTFTPIATATATPTATSSTGTGGSGNVKIISPTDNSAVNDNTPTIKGTAPAGSTVTITIYSTPITTTVTADANGNWQYTPSQALADGSHSVTIASGSSTASSSFTVKTGSAELPVTGGGWPSILGIGVGAAAIIVSILIAI